MPTDNTNTSNADCTCGGCGTNTTCAHTSTDIKANSSGATYVYAAPSTLSDPAPFWPNTETGANITLTPDVEMRTVLQDEIIKDLLKRVQRLEEQNLELQGSLDALIDIMDDEGQDPTRENQLRAQMKKLFSSDEPLVFLRTLLRRYSGK